MNILAFDTSSSACSIALLVHTKVTAVHEIAPMQQAKTILPLIEDLLKNAKLSLEQLNAIAFGCGPGSFTGMRIASCVAQGLGFAAQRPLMPISSLAILAQTAYQQKGWKKIMVAVDARMNQIYWAQYQIASLDAKTVTLIGEELICAPNEVTLPEGEDWYGVGDGWALLTDALIKKSSSRPIEINLKILPHATALLSIAQLKMQSGEGIVAPAEALPSYLR